MFKPGDLLFQSATSSIIKEKDGTYTDVKTTEIYSNFNTWLRENTGPYTIAFSSAEVEEEHEDPVSLIQKAASRFAKCKTMGHRFDCAEEAFYVCRGSPEICLLYSHLRTLIMEMAMTFLLYDDIAAHPVWLHCAQEAARILRTFSEEGV
jgi:hypothetical protein